jgi:superfamily II DNA helicase RecQ
MFLCSAWTKLTGTFIIGNTTKQADVPTFSLSQWAHNFRPCYLRLGTVLQLIEPDSVLAMTATAEPRVVDDICSRLGICQAEESVRLLKANRDNIDVECSFHGSQEERLTKVRR